MNKVFLLLSLVLLSFSTFATGQVKAGRSAASSGISYEKKVLNDRISRLSDPAYYQSRFSQIETEADSVKLLKAVMTLRDEVDNVLDIQSQLVWLNTDAVKLAFDDMKKNRNYLAEKYEPMWQELQRLAGKGFKGIYQGEAQALADAVKALELKRQILLGNPLLDADKIVAARYILGKSARNAMAPKLGTQNNNWSNQGSAGRSGFNASIVELSNLRGEVNVREVYKPKLDSPISDLRLHWDGNRMMFTQLCNDRRWNIFEVQLDGTGFHPLIENEEPDLEFYDGTYLPDGRIIATSNIGYQRVPCLSGSNPVGNMVIYDPKDHNLRRLTFDQDGNWNPVIMNNGRVMYTRWE